MSIVEKWYFNLNLIQVLVLLRTLGYKGESVVVWFEDLIPFVEYEGLTYDADNYMFNDGSESLRVTCRGDHGCWTVGHFPLG